MVPKSLAIASKWLYQLNPTLLDAPPTPDDEYCYLGPDGSAEGAILCKDVECLNASCVGSWMLPPEQHVLEGQVVAAFCFLVLSLTHPLLHKNMDKNSIQIQHPRGTPEVSLFCVGMILCYKYFGFHNRLFYVTMPCNMQWILSFLQCFVIPQSWILMQHTLLQMRLSYLLSVVIPIVTPETDDCTMPGEYLFYWFNHIVLLVLPIAYLANGSVSCLPPPQSTHSGLRFNVVWWAWSCAVFALFYFVPVTLMAIYSGLNLNFMLQPPTNHFVLTGHTFRCKAVSLLALLFALSRGIVYSVERYLAKRNASKFKNGK